MGMLLYHSGGQESAAKAIEAAVEEVLESGIRPPDLAQAGESVSGTKEVTEEVVRCLAGAGN
jgi:3-isopropylmalate dehydrogenase